MIGNPAMLATRSGRWATLAGAPAHWPPSCRLFGYCACRRSFAEEILQQILGRVENFPRGMDGHRKQRRRRVWLRTARTATRDLELIGAIIAAKIGRASCRERAG